MRRFLIQTCVFSVLLIFAWHFSSSFVYAQAGSGTLASAYIELDPQYPKPGDRVRAALKTSSVDIKSSQIIWRMNGEVVLQGYGMREYTFQAGPVGTISGLDVTATSPSGNVVRAQKKFGINDVSFAWEGNTYVPPFFSGRALVSPGAEARVVAFPMVFDGSGKLYNQNNLWFEWMVNGKVNDDASGRGKNTAVLKTERPFDGFKITLTIYDSFGEALMRRFFEVPTTNPQIVFYEDSPLLGIRYGNGFGDAFFMEDEELALVAEPYYASAVTRTDANLEYAWDIDGQAMNVPGTIVLRPEGAGQGSASVSLTILNEGFILQRFQKRVVIELGTNTNSNASNPLTQPI